MQQYLFEKSNDRHPGLVVMQNANAGSQVPLLDYKNTVNKLAPLLNASNQFITLLANSCTNDDEFGELIDVALKLVDQIQQVIPALNRKNGKIVVPDADYFLKHYNNIIRMENEKDIQENGKRLKNSFVNAMKESINSNNKEATIKGINKPNPTK